MPKRLVNLLAVILLLGSSCTNPSSTSPAPTVSFDGEVLRGQDFEHEIEQNLVFRLRYFAGDGEGWEIWVGDRTRPDCDFSACVTPPFRGVNSRLISGWHFRNPDNSGPPDPEDLRFPQEVRGFWFVLDETDCQIADDALGKLMWPYQYSEEEVDEAQGTHEQLQTAKGILTITQLELGNLTVGELAWIDRMEFTVELWLPPEWRA